MFYTSYHLSFEQLHDLKGSRPGPVLAVTIDVLKRQLAMKMFADYQQAEEWYRHRAEFRVKIQTYPARAEDGAEHGVLDFGLRRDGLVVTVVVGAEG